MSRRGLGLLLMAIACVAAFAAIASAQNAAPPTGEASWLANLLGTIPPTQLCMAIGAVIAVVVKYGKALPIVQRFPKTTAFVLSAVAAFLQHLVFGDGQMGQVATCVVTQLVAAIGTHEVLLSSQSVPSRVVQMVKTGSDTIPGPPRA